MGKRKTHGYRKTRHTGATLNLKGNKRLEGESFEAYKNRRAIENIICKSYLTGESRVVPKLNVILARVS